MWEPKATHVAGREEHFTCSGIVVTVRPGAATEVRAALASLEGVQLHQEDLSTGRIVVTQVAPSDAAQAEGLRAIQRIPGVLAADLVYYHREEPGARAPEKREREDE